MKLSRELKWKWRVNGNGNKLETCDKERTLTPFWKFFTLTDDPFSTHVCSNINFLVSITSVSTDGEGSLIFYVPCQTYFPTCSPTSHLYQDRLLSRKVYLLPLSFPWTTDSFRTRRKFRHCILYPSIHHSVVPKKSFSLNTKYWTQLYVQSLSFLPLFSIKVVSWEESVTTVSFLSKYPMSIKFERNWNVAIKFQSTIDFTTVFHCILGSF